MRLGLRFNNRVDESQDVTPRSKLRRKQVAWSLYRATTLEDWVVGYLEDQYADMVLPRMSPGRLSIVDWGVRARPYGVPLAIELQVRTLDRETAADAVRSGKPAEANIPLLRKELSEIV